MKKLIILFIAFFIFGLNSNTYAEVKKDCTKFSKLSPKYWNCKSENLSKSSKDYTLTPDLSNLKEKKTLADIFKKKKKN